MLVHLRRYVSIGSRGTYTIETECELEFVEEISKELDRLIELQIARRTELQKKATKDKVLSSELPPLPFMLPGH